jgi:hypothetical protein
MPIGQGSNPFRSQPQTAPRSRRRMEIFERIKAIDNRRQNALHHTLAEKALRHYPNLRQESATTFFGEDAERICSARKMWITALAIPQKQSQIKPFAGIPSARLKVNSQV